MSDVVPGNRGGGEGREDVDPDVSLITDFQVITDIRVSECASVSVMYINAYVSGVYIVCMYI